MALTSFDAFGSTALPVEQSRERTQAHERLLAARQKFWNHVARHGCKTAPKVSSHA
jgi:hypothetical protein